MFDTRQAYRQISRPADRRRLQGMNTRHSVIDSPLGELTVVADGDALTGVYFRHHWHRPARDTFGPLVDAKSDDLIAEAARPADGLPRGRPRRLRPANHAARRRATASRLETAHHDPLRRDRHLRRTRRRARGRHDGAGGRPGRRPQSAEHRRPLPSRGRKQRSTHRIRGRPQAQAISARTRGACRREGGEVVLMSRTQLAEPGGLRRLGRNHR